jgi:hypothetical protein
MATTDVTDDAESPLSLMSQFPRTWIELGNISNRGSRAMFSERPRVTSGPFDVVKTQVLGEGLGEHTFPVT